MVRDPGMVKLHHLHQVVWPAPNEMDGEDMAVAQGEMGLLEESRLDLDDTTEAGGAASLHPSNTATLVKFFSGFIVSSRHNGPGRHAEAVLQRPAQRYRHRVHRVGATQGTTWCTGTPSPCPNAFARKELTRPNSHARGWWFDAQALVG